MPESWSNLYTTIKLNGELYSSIGYYGTNDSGIGFGGQNQAAGTSVTFNSRHRYWVSACHAGC